jgi:hypothetical protein
MSILNNSIIKLGLSSLLFGQEKFPTITVNGTSAPASNTESLNWLDGEYNFSFRDKTGRPVYEKQLASSISRGESKIFWHAELKAWILGFNYYGENLNIADNESYQYISFENKENPTLVEHWEPSFKENSTSNIEINSNLM